MKKIFIFIGCLSMVLSSAGCSPIKKSIKTVIRPITHFGKAASAPVLPAYNGPRANIAVADFYVSAAKAGGAIGPSLRQMLYDALISSNRFNIIEPKASSSQGSADLIITATVTEFEPQASGGKAGLGGGGGVGSGRLGGLLGATQNKARMALDLKVLDSATTNVLAASPVQCQASDVSSNIAGGSLGDLSLSGGLASYINTPMEKAIRTCVIEAVRYLSKAIPQSYYKY